MKKIISVITILALLVMVAACTSSPSPAEGETTPDNTVTETTPEPEPTEKTAEPTNTPEPTKAPVETPAEPDIVIGADGEYEGVGTGGMGGKVTVKVTVSGGAITAIEILKQNETEGIGTLALEDLPKAIIAAQSVNVDDITGATLSSVALKAAVRDALSE